jgi:hypothetical protein
MKKEKKGYEFAYNLTNETGSLTTFIGPKNAILMVQRTSSSHGWCVYTVFIKMELDIAKALKEHFVGFDFKKLQDTEGTVIERLFALVHTTKKDLETILNSYEEYLNYCKKQDAGNLSLVEYEKANNDVGVKTLCLWAKNHTPDMLTKQMK